MTNGGEWQEEVGSGVKIVRVGFILIKRKKMKIMA